MAEAGRLRAKKTSARKTASSRSRATPPEPRPRPVAKLFQVYLYAVTLVTVLILLFSGARAVFGLVRVAIPGETAKQGPGFDAPFWELSGEGVSEVAFPEPEAFQRSAERRRGLAEVGEAGILTVLAFVAFRLHWRRAEELRGTFEATDG